VGAAAGAGVNVRDIGTIFPQATQGHLTPKDVGLLAARAGVNTVVLTHLTFRESGNYAELAAEVRQYFGGRVPSPTT